VVRHHWDPRLESLFDRVVKRSLVNQANSDAVNPCRDRGIQSINHIGGDGLLGAGPLESASQKRAGVLRTIPGGDKERVGGDVIDESKFPFWMLRKLTERLAFGSFCAGGYANSEGGEREQCSGGGGPAQCLASGNACASCSVLGETI